MDINKLIDEHEVSVTDMLYLHMFGHNKVQGFGTEKICYQCKQEFFVPNSTTYKYKLHRSKNKDVWFCKWSCMCAYRREQHDKRKKNRTV